VWAHDFERLSEREFEAKYGTPRRRRRGSTPRSALSLKDAAVAAHEEEHRLQTLESHLVQQLETVRREKKDVAELLEFLERKRGAEPGI
jgi:hypothetical protein